MTVHLRWQFVLAIGASILGLSTSAGSAKAAIVFKAEQTSYSASPTGAFNATVRILLVQTSGTTTVSDGGGLNSVGLKVVPTSPPAFPARLLSITQNPSFNGNNTVDPNNGVLYEEFSNNSTGLPPESPNTWYLGTFTYSGQTSGGQPAQTTTFTVSTRGGTFSETFTANGANIDSQIQSSQFTVTVPEPGSAAVFALTLAIAMMRRRRVS